MNKEEKEEYGYKLDFLKESLKDVQETVRAQDRKASYMMVIAIFTFTGFGAYGMALIENIINTTKDNSIKYTNIEFILFFTPTLFLILSMFYLLNSYFPVNNPTEILEEKDKELSANKFFINIGVDKLSSKNLVQNLEFKELLQVLYIEIMKLSYIRDIKIEHIQFSQKMFKIGISFILVHIFIIHISGLNFLIPISIFEIITSFIYFTLNCCKRN